MEPERLTIDGRMIERYPIRINEPREQALVAEGREAWLQLRSRDVTASAAGALLGGHPYVSAYALWALKSGKIQEEALETPPMRRGRLLEPVAIELLKEERPDWEITRGAHYYRDPLKRLGATPDAFARTSDGQTGIIQIKSVEPSIFRKNWHGEEGTEPPLWIALQAMVEATLTGADFALVAALTVSHGIEIHLVEVDLSHQATIIGKLEDAIADFWKMIDAGTMPDVDYGRDLKLIEDLYRPSGETVSLVTDNEVLDLCAERTRLGQAISESEKRLGTIKGNLLAKLGTASFGLLPDGRLLRAMRINRKAYSVKAGNYLTVTVIKGKTNGENS
jgi:predicted phage-related endonuclease